MRDEALRREFRTLSAYLVGGDPGELALRHYVAWHEGPGAALKVPRFDAALVSLARTHPFLTRLVDVHAARFRRDALIRTKLVLVLALAECSPATFRAIDAPRSKSRAGVYLRLAASAWLEFFLLVLGALVLFPLQALFAVLPARPAQATA